MDDFLIFFGIIAVYFVGFFITARVAYTRLGRVEDAYDGESKRYRAPDTDDIIFIGGLWMFALPFFALKWIWDRTVVRPTKMEKEVEVHNEAVETQKRLLELSDKAEAELGLSEVSSNLLRNSLGSSKPKSRAVLDYDDW